jgi:hypothetical protein
MRFTLFTVIAFIATSAIAYPPDPRADIKGTPSTRVTGTLNKLATPAQKEAAAKRLTNEREERNDENTLNYFQKGPTHPDVLQYQHTIQVPTGPPHSGAHAPGH